MIKKPNPTGGDPVPAWRKKPFLTAIDQKLCVVEDWLNLISVFIIMFLMFFATAEIIGRYVFNAPIPGHVEIVELIMAGVVFLGIAYTERVGGHVRMELFLTRVLKGRVYHFAEALGIALSLFVYIFIFIFSVKATLFAYEIGDNTGYLFWPTWPSKLMIPIGSLFLCFRFSLELVQQLLQAVSGEEVRELRGENEIEALK